MFSCVMEGRVPHAHPLSKLRVVVDALLAIMRREFEAASARRSRPSVPREILHKALLLQILFSIRSERKLVKTIDNTTSFRMWWPKIKDKHTVVHGGHERHTNYKTDLKVQSATRRCCALPPTAWVAHGHNRPLVR